MNDAVWDAYPELFHYTSQKGLEGILRSQTLWATNARYLNDASELRLMRGRLPDLIVREIENALHAKARRDIQHKVAFEREGGFAVVARRLAQEWTSLMHDVLIEGDAAGLGFFVTSFSAEPPIDRFSRYQGLLSQWRAYGRDGGYAIVFDTKGFNTLLKKEVEQWKCQITFDDVAYENDLPVEVERKLACDLKSICDAISQWIDEPRTIPKSAFRPFISCAARYKHHAFCEEREVRLIIAAERPSNSPRLQQQTTCPTEMRRYYFERNGTIVPCVHLFERCGDEAALLPINRIIVGPHRDQERRTAGLKSVLADLGLSHIVVSESDIPYLE